jgi:hypothetical protein
MKKGGGFNAKTGLCCWKHVLSINWKTFGVKDRLIVPQDEESLTTV